MTPDRLEGLIEQVFAVLNDLHLSNIEAAAVLIGALTSAILTAPEAIREDLRDETLKLLAAFTAQ